MHTPTPSTAPTDGRENPPPEGWHAGAAFLWDVWIDVLKDGVTQMWYQKGSSNIFDGASLIPEVPVAMEMRREVSSVPPPDHSQGLGREHRLLSMSGLHFPLFQAGPTM